METSDGKNDLDIILYADITIKQSAGIFNTVSSFINALIHLVNPCRSVSLHLYLICVFLLTCDMHVLLRG